jgi:hypothetical protein
MEYEFDLSFRLPNTDADSEELVGRLAEAGCDDAAVGIGAPGRIGLMFARGGVSAQQAIIGAITDAQRAIPEAELCEVKPDLVGLTDIADLIGVTRQNMRKLMVKHAATFPSAVHGGTTTIWHLAPVLEWLITRGYPVDQRLLDVARTAMQINLVKEMQYLDHSVANRIRALLARPKDKAADSNAA